MTNQAIVDTIVKRIVARFQPARILLFGSRAAPTIAGATSTCSSSRTRWRTSGAVEMGRALDDLTVSKDIVVTTPDEIARRCAICCRTASPSRRTWLN